MYLCLKNVAISNDTMSEIFNNGGYFYVVKSMI